MESTSSAESIFKQGSKTFFGSSIFFPNPVRDKITTLYAFVRQIDDLVDCIPQNKKELYEYWSEFKYTRKGKISKNPIIILLQSLRRRSIFNISGWTRFSRLWKRTLPNIPIKRYEKQNTTCMDRRVS